MLFLVQNERKIVESVRQWEMESKHIKNQIEKKEKKWIWINQKILKFY